jgi:electron transfer flavoprotein beta subunit
MPSSRARVTRETDRGRETLDVTLPAVITVDLHLNQPRLLSLYDIVQARDKPRERVPGEQIVPQCDARVSVIHLEPPPPRAPCRLVADVAELVAALRDEERVI